MLQRLAALKLGPRAPDPWPPTELGVLERWYAAQPVPRVAGFVLELERAVSPEALRRALEALCARYPDALAVTLVHDRRGEPRFARCERGLPLTLAESDDAWALAARGLHAPFPDDRPLWRVDLTPSGRSLVATFHHVIADGMSAAIFARELLALLRGACLPPRTTPRQPLDARLDLRPSLGTWLRELRAKKPDEAFYAGPACLAGPRQTSLHALELPAALVAALRERARREGATVHGALCAAGLAASAVCARDAGALSAGRAFHARLLSPISLRELARPRPSDLGVYLCGSESDHALAWNASLWRFAAAYARALKQALPDTYQRLGLLRFAGDLRARARALEGRANARTATLEVSNLTVVEGLGAGRFWFIQGNHYHGPLFNLSLATCAQHGVLRGTLATPTPVVRPDVAARFAQVFERTIAACAEGEVTFGAVLERQG